MMSDLKDIAGKTAIIELALAIVLAQYISNILVSLVTDIILPPIGLLCGRRSVPSLFYNLTPEKTLSGGPVDSIEKAHYAGAPIIAYGAFLEDILQLLVLVVIARFVLRWIRRVRATSTPNTNESAWPPVPADQSAE